MCDTSTWSAPMGTSLDRCFGRSSPAQGATLRPTRLGITPVRCTRSAGIGPRGETKGREDSLNQRRCPEGTDSRGAGRAGTGHSARPALKGLAMAWLTVPLASAHLLLAQRLPHQQRVLVGLGQHQAVERVLVRAQRVDGGAAVVDDAVQQAELRRGPPHVSHADVDADVRQAALLPAGAQPALQLLGAGLGVTAGREEEAGFRMGGFQQKQCFCSQCLVTI